MKKNDYLVIDHPTEGVFLGKVVNVRGTNIHVLHTDNMHLPNMKRSADIEPEHIILNLGESPRKGHVFGVDTNDLYVKTKTHDIAGDVHFFYHPTKEVFESLWRSFNIVNKQLNKVGLRRLLNDDMVWEVYSGDGGGKFAGMYIYKQGTTPVIKVRPEKMAASQYPYVIAHELGHHLHHNYASNSDTLQAAWVKLYNTTINVKPVTAQVCRELKEQFHDTAQTVGEFRRAVSQDDELRTAFARILSYIKMNHNLDARAIDLLLSTNNWDAVDAMWPTAVQTKDLEPLVSEYALKHWHELLAEAFAFYVTGISLPGKVKTLMEKTIAYSKTQFG